MCPRDRILVSGIFALVEEVDEVLLLLRGQLVGEDDAALGVRQVRAVQSGDALSVLDDAHAGTLFDAAQPAFLVDDVTAANEAEDEVVVPPSGEAQPCLSSPGIRPAAVVCDRVDP